MPFPFPDFPTYKQYAAWLESQGIRVEFGKNKWGGFMFAARPDGGLHIYEPAIRPDDSLVPITIQRVDMRLGVLSPWNPLSATQLEAADK